MYIGLTLIAGTAVTSTNVAFLCIVDKSYLSFAVVPVLQVVLLSRFVYFELKSDERIDYEDNAPIVKKCFDVAKATTSACYVVQTALIFSYLKNSKFATGHLHYTLVGSFLTSAMGSSATIITSSPLDFRSDLMCGFLRKIPVVMPFLFWVIVAVLSAEFLDAKMEAFAVIIPFFAEIIVNLSRKSGEQHANEDTSTSTDSVGIDSMFGLSIVVLCAFYTVTFGSEEYNSYFTWSVLFFLLVIISTLIRMALPFRPARTVTESINYALPVVELLVGLVLLSIAIHKYIKGMNILSSSPPP